MYIFNGLLLFITKKRPLKLKIIQNSWRNKKCWQIEPYMARNIKKNWLDRQNIGFLWNTYTRKSQMYIHTRVNLLYTLCYEIPCIAVSVNIPHQVQKLTDIDFVHSIKDGIKLKTPSKI